MAFEMLSDRLQVIFKKLKGQGKLTEQNMDSMLKEVRLALLEADVNVGVAKDFIKNVKEKMLGEKVLNALSPSQMVVKIVNAEIVELLGKDSTALNITSGLNVLMMVGLQGSGKTTTTAKIANLLRKKNAKKPLLVACDIYRPGAIEQLQQLGNTLDIPVFTLGTEVSPVEIATQGVNKAKAEGYDLVIIDTAGRLHIDETLMQELKQISEAVKIDETLLVVDAMSGQDAVNVAQSFHNLLSITGLVMTKLDGDARGGAALSIRQLTGIPIKFSGVGEKIDDLELFYPDRMADRILGMGDVLNLIEKAQEKIDEKKAKRSMNRMMSGNFDLEDMLDNLEQANNMGPLGGIMKMLPGMPKISEEDQLRAEQQMKKTKAVILSMTKEERKNPDILRASRKERIAKGCGLQVSDVNRVLKQYEQTKTTMKQMSSLFKGGKFPKFPGMKF